MRFTMQTRTLITCSVAIVLFAGIASQQSYSQERKAVSLPPTRGLPFSDCIVVGDTLYVPGQEGTDESNKLAAGGIGPETTAAVQNIQNIQKVLKAAGFELKNVVSVTVYLADIHEFPDMNKIYKNVMPDPKPARAPISAAALVNNARDALSALAVKQK